MSRGHWEAERALRGNITFSVFSGGLLTLGSGSNNLRPVTVPDTGHAVFWSGPGRVNWVQQHQAISGVAAHLYDAAVAAVSGVGTFGNSGHSILYTFPANSFGNLIGGGPQPIPLGNTFNSGLSLSLASGAAGVTVNFTPAVL